MLQSGKQQFVVVAYDISANRRRQKIAKVLESYGQRVNYSVFECLLTEKKLAEMKKKLVLLANPKFDTILYYPLCKKCVDNRTALGAGKPDNTPVRIL